MDLYVSSSERDFGLSSLISAMKNAGVTRLLVKVLAANDNSKNQPYLGGDWGLLNIIPTGSFETFESRSRKPGEKKRSIMRAPVRLSWMDTHGGLHPAPQTKLILYPQYPEVRLSGFLAGADAAPSTLMDSKKLGRTAGRLLFLGTRPDGEVIGFMGRPDTPLAREVEQYEEFREIGVFKELLIPGGDATDEARFKLLRELARIHAKGWVFAKQLKTDGSVEICKGPRCVGHTLEAELGIAINARAAPDFEGWEVKALTVDKFESAGGRVITLMTPEPTGGFYGSKGAESFVRRFGCPSQSGSGKLHFTGRHVANTKCAKTTLTLELLGYDDSNGELQDASKGIALMTPEGEVAALWHYSKLIDHWKRKHDRAAYVPAMVQRHDLISFWYGSSVTLGTGTDFSLVLAAIAGGSVYLDPGTSLGDRVHARSQFRIVFRDIGRLYHAVQVFDLAHPLVK
jgi:MvaI/BcnI restriction endonuclease family protein